MTDRIKRLLELRDTFHLEEEINKLFNKINKYEKALKEITDFDDRDINRYGGSYEFYRLKEIARESLK